MISKIFIMDGYGLFVWSAFAFTFLDTARKEASMISYFLFSDSPSSLASKLTKSLAEPLCGRYDGLKYICLRQASLVPKLFIEKILFGNSGKPYNFITLVRKTF